MSLDDPRPRVTLGIATYNRATYLRQAIASCLAQDYESLEVLVVIDGSTNPEIDAIVAEFAGDARLRTVRHESNLGIAAAYNSFISAGRGELIAMLGDDDVSLPDRIRRQVEIFDRFPDTGVVHGDAAIIDAAGRVTGAWNSGEFSPAGLVHSFYRRHNFLVDPSRMIHRRVYETVGGYDGRYPVAQDFHFWLRAARHFRFRHCAGGPLIQLRRHGDNGSDDSNLAAQAREVNAALTESLSRYSLRELVPELDWAVLEPAAAQRQALERLAEQVSTRAVPAPVLAAQLRARAARVPRAPAPARNGRKLVMTMFGFEDSGGGTILPRLIAKELVRRGWEVVVFHAATAALPDGGPYGVREWEADGVRLVGVHNRPHGLFDLGHPGRELDDPPIRDAFRALLARERPDVVHFHNLHNLGASLIDQAAAFGIPAYMTTHNYWLMCPRAYLLDHSGQLCAGPGDGARCASCVRSSDTDGHRERLAGIRAAVERGVRAVLAVSDSVRQTLLGAGYPPELVDVVRQSMPHESEIWAEVGAQRPRGRRGADLTVAFLGSAYPHKGPQLLVRAAQRTEHRIRVRIHGDADARFAAQLRALDTRGVVEIWGGFAPTEVASLLAGADVAALPSTWWDCAPLVADECHAAGLPLLVPRMGGLGEAVRDEIDGLTFAGLDVEDLARQLDRLAGEPGLLERLQSGIEAPGAFAAHVDQLEAYYRGERPAAIESDPRRGVAVRWQGDHGLRTSLSIINARVSERLAGPVQRITRGQEPLDPPLPHAAEVEVRHQWPPDFRPAPSGRLAAIVPWEFGAVPRDWVAAIQDTVDELWVPSEFVRQMYVAGGVDPDRVAVLPNGVDPELFTPAGEPLALPASVTGTRFLFVGGLILRKGPDLLLKAWLSAFAERDDVTLVIKDFGADGVYRNADRGPIRAHADSGASPRIVLIEDELTDPEMAALYRSCDVLVHPYRGEGFAMPVLEAMACGLPVITTAGGPTDEFCPPEAGWRVPARRVYLNEERVDSLATVGRPWMLEPDVDALAAMMRAAAGDPEARAVRGQAGRAAAAVLSWDAVAARYEQRLRALRDRRPLNARTRVTEPRAWEEAVSRRVLAVPAWRGLDRLPELLAEWCDPALRGADACLYLLADPRCDGSPEELEGHVLAAAQLAGADIEQAPDITVLMEPGSPERDASLYAGIDAIVALHDAADGHARQTRAAGGRVLALGHGELAALIGPATTSASAVPA